MRLGAIPAFLLFMAAVLPPASAAIATLGPSNQNFTLTGIGANASLEGQSKVGWGSCAFDGTNTNCTLSGTFTGFDGGGTYSFVLSYPGTGAFPLIAVSPAGGSSAVYTVTVNALEPGFLAPVSFLIKGNQNIVALFAGTLTYVLPVAVSGISPARAKVGDNLTLYGIGFGPVSPSIPAGQIVQPLNSISSGLQIAFGGVTATVSYAGLAPGFVGLYQFNVVVPNVPASDTTPVTFTLGGKPGPQNLVIAIN
jgi:uncharacterized protein (TIGR03437 family)